MNSNGRKRFKAGNGRDVTDLAVLTVTFHDGPSPRNPMARPRLTGWPKSKRSSFARRNVSSAMIVTMKSGRACASRRRPQVVRSGRCRVAARDVLESPVFRTVLGSGCRPIPRWRSGSAALSCHAPAVTVFPQRGENQRAGSVRQAASGRDRVRVVPPHQCRRDHAGVAADLQSSAGRHVIRSLCGPGRKSGASGDAGAVVPRRELLHVLSFPIR